jgi:hypothetical protein
MGSPRVYQEKNMTIHVRLLVVGNPENLLDFLQAVRSLDIPDKCFSLDRIIRAPMPVPANDIRDWRRSNWGSPHDAYNVTLLDGPGELAIEFDCWEFPGKAIQKLIARHQNLGFSGIYEDGETHASMGFSGSRSKRRKPLGNAVNQPSTMLAFDRAA